MNAARSIILIGMMGAGKSSVGRCLQRQTGLARFDTDEIVATEFGIPVRDIFAQHGEDRFREAETEALRKLAPSRAAIIVTGGGTILRPENVELLKRLGAVVWLHGDEKKLFERAVRRNERPLLQTGDPEETFLKLLRDRKPVYAAAADIEVDTTALDHEQVADLVLRKIEELRE